MQQQQHIERIVDPLRTEPVVAVVPVAHPVTVQALQFRGEHRVQILFRVAADGGVAQVQGDVEQVVQAGKQVHLGELADPREKTEADVSIAELERAVKPAQEVAICAGNILRMQRIKDRLVILVDEHDHSLACLLMERVDEVAHPCRRRVVVSLDARDCGEILELGDNLLAQQRRGRVTSAAEVEPEHRMAGRPVPSAVDVEAAKQVLAPLEKFLESIHQQALAEAARAGKKVMFATPDQLVQVRRLVDVVVALLAYLAEGLDANRQLAPHRGLRVRFHLLHFAPRLVVAGVIMPRKPRHRPTRSSRAQLPGPI